MAKDCKIHSQEMKSENFIAANNQSSKLFGDIESINLHKLNINFSQECHELFRYWFVESWVTWLSIIIWMKNHKVNHLCDKINQSIFIFFWFNFFLSKTIKFRLKRSLVKIKNLSVQLITALDKSILITFTYCWSLNKFPYLELDNEESST